MNKRFFVAMADGNELAYKILTDTSVAVANGCKGRFQYGAPMDLADVTLQAAPAMYAAKSRNIAASAVFHVFPNPANTYLTLQLNGSEQSNADIWIIDMQGKIIDSQSGFDLANTYNVSALPAGQYIVCLKQGQEHYTASFIKQ